MYISRAFWTNLCHMNKFGKKLSLHISKKPFRSKYLHLHPGSGSEIQIQIHIIILASIQIHIKKFWIHFSAVYESKCVCWKYAPCQGSNSLVCNRKIHNVLNIIHFIYIYISKVLAPSALNNENSCLKIYRYHILANTRRLTPILLDSVVGHCVGHFRPLARP